jgi:hypothetical protein
MGWFIALALVGVVAAALLSAFGRRLGAALAALCSLTALGLFFIVPHGPGGSPARLSEAVALSPIDHGDDVVGTRDCWAPAGNGWRACERQVSFAACSAALRSGRCAAKGGSSSGRWGDRTIEP